MVPAGDGQLDTLTTLDLGYLLTIHDDSVAPRSVAPAVPVSRHDYQCIGVFRSHRQVPFPSFTSHRRQAIRVGPRRVLS
jgi:hypothetical protein